MVDQLFGDGGRKLALQKQQRRSLAEFTKQQGEIDQAGATGAGQRGRGLLTFIKGQGETKLGSARAAQ